MSEPQNKRAVPPRPASADRVATGPRLAGPALDDPTSIEADALTPQPTRLKIVTVSPGRASFPDTEASLPEQRAVKKDPYLGATVDGRYKVEAILGEGGMGVVYRCSHTIIGKKVAMKLLRADLARDTEVTERFLNEAKAASAIGNPHIIDISDFGQFTDGSTYFIMEYLVGSPLSKALDGVHPAPVERILHLAEQLAEGLSAAHAAGIVHRDLKPDNIFLIERGAEKDFVKILDFGIAKVSSSSGDRLTRAGAVFGTPHYMSPEQAAGAPVDQRGDIYSLGVILYELSSGRVPFDADNFMGILTQHMYKPPAPIREVVRAPHEVPPGLEAIVLKCLSKRAEDRYQSMQELLVDLRKLKAGEVPVAVNEMMARSGGFNVPANFFDTDGLYTSRSSTTLRNLGRDKRWPVIGGLVGVALALLIVIAVLASSGKGEASRTATARRSAPAQSVAASVAALAQELPVVPSTKKVVVASDPLDAHVFRGEEDLGASPVVIELADGERAELKIRREGYKETTLDIDGQSSREVIKLERLARTAGAAGAPARVPPVESAAKRKPVIGGNNGIVDPWKSAR